MAFEHGANAVHEGLWRGAEVMGLGMGQSVLVGEMAPENTRQIDVVEEAVAARSRDQALALAMAFLTDLAILVAVAKELSRVALGEL